VATLAKPVAYVILPLPGGFDVGKLGFGFEISRMDLQALTDLGEVSVQRRPRQTNDVFCSKWTFW